jgi:hypothetical protein
MQGHEVFANSKMSGMHFEATRGAWMQVISDDVWYVVRDLFMSQERAAPAFGNSSLQGALRFLSAHLAKLTVGVFGISLLIPGMAGWDEDEDSDSDGEPLQVATGGSLYHGLSVLRCVTCHTPHIQRKTSNVRREHEGAVAVDGTASSKTFAITASRFFRDLPCASDTGTRVTHMQIVSKQATGKLPATAAETAASATVTAALRHAYCARVCGAHQCFAL